VSKVVNQRYGVAEATASRVQAVIRELGYEASLVAQSLRNHRTHVVGILVADLEPFSTELLKGAGDALRGSEYELVVYSAGGKAGDDVGWERRGHYGLPVIAVDPHTGPSELPTIDSDNLRGGRLATEHLLSLGHRRIAMLAGRPDLQSAQLRERGYRQALAAAGVRVTPGLVRVGGYDPAVSAEAARRLLAGPTRPTAVFAANDLSAIAVIGAARSLGLRVPEDLSVVGFDNVPESALCTPALTTVEQPIRTMGRRAVEVLIRLLGGEALDTTHITLATNLVVRHSTAPPPDGQD
jgi:LacI family transcriptional regulator